MEKEMKISQKYHITISWFTEKHLLNLPHSFDIDFDKVTKELNISGGLISRSVAVTNSKNHIVPVYLSDSFLWGNSGTVHFLIEDTSDVPYTLHFDTDLTGSEFTPCVIGIVGDGDPLCHNSNQPLPLFNGMSGEGNFYDINGDGFLELITPQPYAFLKEREWHIVNAYQNIGTQISPVWGEATPLRYQCDGEIKIIHGASSVFVCEDGRLLTCGYGLEDFNNAVCMYKPSGLFEKNGYPLYEKPLVYPLQKEGYFSSICELELMGQRGILAARSETVNYNKDDNLWFDISQEERETASWPRFGFISELLFYSYSQNNGLNPPQPLLWEDESLILGRTHLSIAPVIHPVTGQTDLIFTQSNCDYSNGAENSLTIPIYLCNLQNKSKPIFSKAKEYPNISDHGAMSLRYCYNGNMRGLIRSSGQLGGQFELYPFLGYDDLGYPELGEACILLQANPYLNAGCGYAAGSFSSRNELISGCECGVISRLSIQGSQTFPVIKKREPFCIGEKVITLLNGAFDDKGSFAEAPLGQASGFYIDVDFDGIFDCVAKCGRRTYFFHNNGSNDTPMFSPPIELLTEQGNRMGIHRSHPIFEDFTGNGIPDCICDSSDGNSLLLYRGFMCREKLCFHEGEPLFYDNGQKINPNEWHHYNKHWAAGEYTKSGIKDILLSTCNMMLLLVNCGTNQAPIFKRPTRILPDNSLENGLGHHISLPLPVDWDNNGLQQDLLVCGEGGMFYLLRRNYLEQEQRNVKIVIKN